MRAFSKFRALAPAERRVVIAAALFMPMLSAALRIVRRDRLPGFLVRPRATHSKAEGLAPERAAMLVGAVAGRLPMRPTCLARSLFLQWILQRQGEGSDLRVGVLLAEGRLEAHAWVECDGIPVNDVPAVSARYQSFPDPVPIEAFFRR